MTRGTLNAHIHHSHLMDQIFQCSFCPMTFTTKGSARRHMASSHKKERPFVCPFCQKTFKTSVLCKKHMKIHRKDLAEANNDELSALTTIETRDLHSRDMTLFTADSSGTVTLPTFATTSQTHHQGELLANIGQDGTITLQQGDQLTNVDLNR